MRLASIVFALALAACGQSTAPPAEAPEVEAPAPSAITGSFAAMSNTAMAITGDIDIQPDVLSFSKGFRIEGGRIDTALEPHTDYSAGGGTIADVTGNGGIEAIELRLVTNVRIAADAAVQPLCGAGTERAQFAALRHVQLHANRRAIMAVCCDEQRGLCGVFL